MGGAQVQLQLQEAIAQATSIDALLSLHADAVSTYTVKQLTLTLSRLREVSADATSALPALADPSVRLSVSDPRFEQLLDHLRLSLDPSGAQLPFTSLLIDLGHLLLVCRHSPTSRSYADRRSFDQPRCHP